MRNSPTIYNAWVENEQRAASTGTGPPRPWIAVSLSFLYPGAGHFYAGQTDKKKIYLKRKMRKERSKIEGVIGNLKKDYSMNLVTLKIKEGAEIQARIAASLFNLNRAIKMI